MNIRPAATLLLTGSLTTLGYLVYANPPGGLPWATIATLPVSLLEKIQFLSEIYLLPALLSFVAISLLQLQFRMAAGGGPSASIFSICLLASLCLVAALRVAASNPASMPSYALGMALSYTTMSRIYAVKMKPVLSWLPFVIRVPWIIWRGNAEAVAELNRRMAGANLKGGYSGPRQAAPGVS